MLGLDLTTLTSVHVIISLVGIATGFVVMRGFLTADAMPGVSALFLVTTVLTSVTGFMFPFTMVLPAHIIGGLSLVLLLLAIVARYGLHLAGPWRAVYVVTALASQYFNLFVLVVQIFRRVPALHALAPTDSGLPQLAANLVIMAIFIVLGRRCLAQF